MKHEPMKLTSSYNNQLYIKVMNGHFATNHSHINQYIDMTTLKVRGTMAAAAAKSMGTEYMASTIVDTIVCMDGTEVIGAYLAETLSQNGITSMNQHKSIYVVTPEVHSSGQLIFRDNLQPMIEGKHVLLLIASATTGKTIKKKSLSVSNTTVVLSQVSQQSSLLQQRLTAIRYMHCLPKRIFLITRPILMISVQCVRPETALKPLLTAMVILNYNL